MLRDNNNHNNESRFLPTTHFNNNNNIINSSPPIVEWVSSDEFDESEIMWSSYDETPSTPTTLPPIHLDSTPSAGLSAALFSPQQPDSPTSLKRKTTSSPISMISSPFSRSSSGGTSYYGKKFHQSAPVNVPIWPSKYGPMNKGSMGMGMGMGLGPFNEEDDDDELLHEDGEIVPPHEMVARSQNTTSFSVMEGAGRTLKGRDLTRVRNAIFQKNGFLE